MSRRNAPSLLSISARPVALGGTLRSPVRARIPISAASVAATPHSQKRREHEKWAKHRSTISGAPNGHRAFQKRHAWSPLGPPTSPERGGELWGPRASGGSDGKISSEFGLIRTWTRDCTRVGIFAWCYIHCDSARNSRSSGATASIKAHSYATLHHREP